MDLVTVKAAVKAWEKAFRAKHKRDPTKEDIKNDPSDIADQYAFYRKLSKQKTSTHLAPSSSSTSTSVSSRAGSSRATPKTVPNSEYPTTPTPPTRRSNSLSSQNLENSSTQADLPALQYPSRKGKQKATAANEDELSRAHNAALSNGNGVASPMRLLTPKKARPYSGPIHDPNPVNPFAITPKKTPSTSPNISMNPPTQSPHKSLNGAMDSPFIHAFSPRKLREVLQANSLRKVRERDQIEEITPRTRARKRLRGEVVADTPLKTKQPRRKRGEARMSIENGTTSSVAVVDSSVQEGARKGKGAMMVEDIMDEDEFGPSPMKDQIDRTFTPLIDEDDRTDPAGGVLETAAHTAKRGRPSEMMGLFQKTIVKSRLKSGDSHKSVETNLYQESTSIQNSDSAPQLTNRDLFGISVKVPDALLSKSTDAEVEDAMDHEESASQVASTSRTPRKQKVLTLSDGEEDEWDPEGGHVQRQVFITGTRRAVQRARNSLSDSDTPYEDEDVGPIASDDPDLDHHHDEADEDDTVDEYDTRVANGGFGTDAATPESGTNTGISRTSHKLSSPATSTLNPPMLSLLSLHSPKRRSNVDLRVKAIFNPAEANRLRALQRGQDIFVSGEGTQGDDDEGEGLDFEQFEQEDEDREFDDDWEEEPEGWKSTQLGMEDEAW